MSICPECQEDYFRGSCRACGSPVESYLCNEPLEKVRPKSKEYDYWMICSNEKCVNHEGSGYLQDTPRWVSLALPTTELRPDALGVFKDY